MKELQLLSQETETLKLSSDGEAESVRLLRYAGYEGVIAVPLRLLPLVQTQLSDFIPALLNALSLLPNSALLSRVVLIPHSQDKSNENSRNCSLLKTPASYTAELVLPYSGVSLRTELLDCWSEILEEILPVNRYLFQQACFLQPLLAEQTPTYTNDSFLWQYLIRTGVLEELSETEFEKRPLFSLLALDSILRAVVAEPHSNNFAACQMIYAERRENLARYSLRNLLDGLLKIANEAAVEYKAAAAKLLIHIAAVEDIERIRALPALDLRAEPVGETVLQRLKYIECIESLDLSDTYFPAEALRHLSWLPLLRELRLERTRAHNNSIVHLLSCPALEFIDCSDTSISDEGAKHFLSFKSLKTVDLSRTSVSKEMIELLRQAKLEVIYE